MVKLFAGNIFNQKLKFRDKSLSVIMFSKAGSLLKLQSLKSAADVSRQRAGLNTQRPVTERSFAYSYSEHMLICERVFPFLEL